MQDIGLGAGLAAMAFWGFIAAAAVAGIWDGVRKREAQHETLRRFVESGQPIDEKVMNKLLMLNKDGRSRFDRDFKLAALWIMPVSAGLAVFGLILGTKLPHAQTPLLGVAALLACLGIGFWLASNVASRWYKSDDDSTNGQI